MVYAAPIITPVQSAAPIITDNPFVTIARGVLPVIAVLIGVIATLYLIYSGYRYMTAGADSKKTGEARAGIINAVIGIIIIALAYSIINLSIRVGDKINDTVNSSPSPRSNNQKNPVNNGNVNEHISNPG